MEIALLSQLQRQLCSQEFQQSHDLFPGSYSIWWREARANYRHRKRGERHLEKLYLPSHREWGSTAPAKPPMGAPQRAVKPREGEQIPGIQSSWTSLSSFSGKMKASINLISQHFTIRVLWRRGEAPRGERDHRCPGTGRVSAQHRPSHGKNQSLSVLHPESERVGFPAETPSPKGEQCHKPLTVPWCPSTAQKHGLQRCSPTWRQINVH